MNHIRRKNPFWSVAGPLIAYWGIQAVVRFIIQAIIQVPMMTSAYVEQLTSGQITNSQEAMESYLSVIDPVLQGQEAGKKPGDRTAEKDPLFQISSGSSIWDTGNDRSDLSVCNGTGSPVRCGIPAEHAGSIFCTVPSAAPGDGSDRPCSRRADVPRDHVLEIPGKQAVLVFGALVVPVFLHHAYKHGADGLHIPSRDHAGMAL